MGNTPAGVQINVQPQKGDARGEAIQVQKGRTGKHLSTWYTLTVELLVPGVALTFFLCGLLEF